MAKKKGIDLKLILSGLAVLLGLVAFFMLFAPAIKYTVKVGSLSNSTTYKGTQIVFGYTAKADTIVGSIEGEVFKFSFMNLLPYILVLAGIVFSVLSALGKLGSLSKIIAAACFVVAGVLFFMAITFTAYASDNADVVKSFKENCSLQAGPIVAGILSILAGVSALAPMFIKK